MTSASVYITPEIKMPSTAKTRIASIDFLRGLVMLIMAIDHLRDLLHLGHPEPTDIATTTPALFFTRWITHFCAPIFVFLSGVSAFLAGRRRSKNQMAVFLIKRGVWLIFVDFFIIGLIASIDLTYHLIVLQVIWAIGGGMIILGILLAAGFNTYFIGLIGAIIFAAHNITDLFPHSSIQTNLAWQILLTSKGFNVLTTVSKHQLIVSYALIPWTGVMLIGYAVGSLYLQDARKRKRMLVIMGTILLVAFFILRVFNIYGDPAPWSRQQNAIYTLISFLNVTKYPCSLLYLCITLGIGMLLLAFSEGVDNRFSRFIVVYGNVPFFYYVLHWIVAQSMAAILFFTTGHGFKDIDYATTEFPFSASNVGVSLGGIYMAWCLLVLILYFPCRWYGHYKRHHTQWWLSYL